MITIQEKLDDKAKADIQKILKQYKYIGKDNFSYKFPVGKPGAAIYAMVVIEFYEHTSSAAIIIRIAANSLDDYWTKFIRTVVTLFDEQFKKVLKRHVTAWSTSENSVNQFINLNTPAVFDPTAKQSTKGFSVDYTQKHPLEPMVIAKLMAALGDAFLKDFDETLHAYFAQIPAPRTGSYNNLRNVKVPIVSTVNPKTSARVNLKRR